MTYTFCVPGKPVGKGRPRFTKSGHTYTPQTTKDYETAVKWAYKAAGGRLFTKSLPLIVEINAVYPIAKSNSKKIKADKAAGIITPNCQKPDIDNVVKIVLDALNGIAYEDDTQVIAIKAKKAFGITPGVGVTIKNFEGASE